MSTLSSLRTRFVVWGLMVLSCFGFSTKSAVAESTETVQPSELVVGKPSVNASPQQSVVPMHKDASAIEPFLCRCSCSCSCGCDCSCSCSCSCSCTC